MNVQIISYGAGNIRSLWNALSNLSFNPIILSSGDSVDTRTPTILPGVGSYSHCVALLKQTSFWGQLSNADSWESPLIGICVGMQLMFSRGEEGRGNAGLGIFDGDVIHLSKHRNARGPRKTPRIEWGEVSAKEEAVERFAMSKYYFVHSYAVENSDHSLFTTSYDSARYVAAVRKNNVVGFQFHPERSRQNGLELLKWAIEL